ncbi:MAG: helix-turn-helix domain-containing protein [Bacteroidia bacterium]
MESTELQQQFFQHLKTRIPAHVSLVDEIADLLGISNDSAYRRIRGDKQISLQEVQLICKHFQVSLDQLMGLDSNSITFYGNLVDKETFDFEKYLTDMLHQFEMINSLSEKTMYYDAKDIPPFRHFQCLELAAFKYYFWMRTIIKDSIYTTKPFEEAKDYLLEHLHHIGKKIILNYTKIPSVELWNADTINSTLQQIEFYRGSGNFLKEETSQMLFDQLMDLINHIEKEAATGEKFLMGSEPTGNHDNYKLFINEVMMGHNTTLIDTGTSRFVFINHNVLNFMITYDKKFCDYTFDAQHNLMSKSTMISTVSEKERGRFFKMIRDKITRRKNGEANY